MSYGTAREFRQGIQDKGGAEVADGEKSINRIAGICGTGSTMVSKWKRPGLERLPVRFFQKAGTSVSR